MNELYIVAPPGLEEVCAQEALALGLDRVRPLHGGVACVGDESALLRANLGLRTASRILLQLGEGPASEIQAMAAAIDWKRWLPPATTFAVNVSGGGKAPARFDRIIRDAILWQLPQAKAVERDGEQTVHVRIADGQISLRLDSTGEHLHLRGYRQETGAAPLRENLAAGILALAGYDGSQALFDPMCGGGTFLIEAALIALRRPPGIERAFACEAWPTLVNGRGAAERERLRASELPSPTAPILGSDRNAGALGVARRNAQRASVFDHISLSRLDVAAATPPQDTAPGVIVVNPPYGKRVGDPAQALGSLYRSLGETLRIRFGGWTAAILVADAGLGAALRLPSPTEIPLRNGGIPCTLLLAHLPSSQP